MIRFAGRAIFLTLAASLLAFPLTATASAQDAPLLTGKAAFGDWHRDAPGVRRKITVSDLPRPFATGPPTMLRALSEGQELRRRSLRPVSASICSPRISTDPRALRIAPNGDVFVIELEPGRVRVLRGSDGQARRTDQVFASGLDQPFGIAFYPLGSDRSGSMSRTRVQSLYPYRNGDIKAAGPAELVVSDLPYTAGHRRAARPRHARHRFLRTTASRCLSPRSGIERWPAGHG